MKPNKLKFTDTQLLDTLLKLLNTNRDRYSSELFVRTLASTVQPTLERVPSRRINTKTGLPFFSEQLVYTTPTHTIRTTRYGRVISIESNIVLPQDKHTTPKKDVRPTVKPTVRKYTPPQVLKPAATVTYKRRRQLVKE